MIGINSIINSNQIQFKAKASASDDKTARIEERMNKLFGVSLDEFIKVCDDKKFYNDHGMSKQDYYNSDEYADQIASI